MPRTVESALELGMLLRAVKDKADASENEAFKAHTETHGDESRRLWGEALKEQSRAGENYQAWLTTYIFRL